jgi:hypothetical protein
MDWNCEPKRNLSSFKLFSTDILLQWWQKVTNTD